MVPMCSLYADFTVAQTSSVTVGHERDRCNITLHMAHLVLGGAGRVELQGLGVQLLAVDQPQALPEVGLTCNPHSHDAHLHIDHL